MCSSIFEPPPPTAQTEHARDLKFYMVGPQGTRFWAIEAIFEFYPRSRDMSQKPTISEPRLNHSKTPKCANISASRTKFKNLVHWGTTMQNLGSLACSVWAVGGGSKMLRHILYSEETCRFKSRLAYYLYFTNNFYLMWHAKVQRSQRTPCLTRPTMSDVQWWHFTGELNVWTVKAWPLTRLGDTPPA